MTYTQEQLEGMSDGQLNQIIDCIIAYQQIVDDGELGEFTPEEYLENGFVDQGDYCNSWADMGPLIVEAKIAIRPRISIDLSNGDVAATDTWEAYARPNTRDTVLIEDESNPLRPAAEVYILVKQEG